MQNLIKVHQFVHEIFSGSEIWEITKGHNSVVNLRKLTCNNPNLDPVKVNAKSNQIESILSQNIARKRKFDNKQGP